MHRIAVRTGLVALLSVLAVACSPVAPEGSDSSPVPAATPAAGLPLVSPLQPAPTLARPTAPPVPVSAEVFVSPIETPSAGTSSSPLVQPPFLPGPENIVPEPFQLIVRDGNQVWLLSDTGERELIIDTLTRMGMYLGPGGLLGTDSGGYSWGSLSPDGETLALVVADAPFARPRGSEPPWVVHTYLLNVHTGELTLLVDNAVVNWSPDSTRLAFVTQDAEIYVIEAAAGAEPELMVPDAPDCYPMSLTWSPDGRGLAYGALCPRVLEIRTVDEGDKTVRTIGSIDLRYVVQDLGYHLDMAWSPDGEALLYRAPTVEPDGDPGEVILWRLPLEGGVAEPVPGSPLPNERNLSPDGQWAAIYVYSYSDEDDKPGLWLVRQGSEEKLRIQDGSDWYYLMQWSPDGTALVYVSNWQVKTLNLLDGSLQGLYVLTGVRHSSDADIVVLRESEELRELPDWTREDAGELPTLLVEHRDALLLTRERERVLVPVRDPYYWQLAGYSLSPTGDAVAFTGNSIAGGLQGAIGVVPLSPDSPYQALEFVEPRLALGPSWWGPNQLAYTLYSPRVRYGDGLDELGAFMTIDLLTGDRTEQPGNTLHYRSPDGRYVLSGNGSSYADLCLVPHPYRLLDTDTGEETLVVGELENARFMGWSPEGSLLFVLSRPEVTHSVVAVVDSKAGVRRELTAGEERITAAAWSPGGETIAYALCRPSGEDCLSPELRLIQADGSNDRAVPMEGYPADEAGFTPNRITGIEEVAWSLDGEMVVFRCLHGFRVAENVWGVRPDGSNLRPLTQGAGVVVVR